MKVNKKEYNKDEVRKFFKESRERIKEDKMEDDKMLEKHE